MRHLELAPELTVVSVANGRSNAPTARTVLKELFALLEDYAPLWYTEEQHERAVRALAGQRRKRRVSHHDHLKM
jgi:hypothetical protein